MIIVFVTKGNFDRECGVTLITIFAWSMLLQMFMNLSVGISHSAYVLNFVFSPYRGCLANKNVFQGLVPTSIIYQKN